MLSGIVLGVLIGLSVAFALNKLLKTGRQPSKSPSGVIWFTGLSGAGKTTIANKLTASLKSKGIEFEHLDGDGIRKIFPATGFTRADREEHIKRVAHLAASLERHGVLVITSLISPYEESRNFARSLCKRFAEVYISTPLEVCEKRDVKGLYKKARSGEISNFTGISEPFEKPLSADLTIDTSRSSVEDSVAQIEALIENLWSS